MAKAATALNIARFRNTWLSFFIRYLIDRHSLARHSMISRRLLCAAAALLPIPALAQSGDPRFAAWLRGVRAEALKAGVDEGTLDAALGSVEEVPQVLELARNQPEFKMTFDRYLEIVVSNERVSRGRALLQENRAIVDRFAAPAGIPASTVVALWGIESNYGTRLGDFEVVRRPGDARLQQFPRAVLPQPADRGAQDRVARTYRPARHEGIVGGRHGPVPVHPDELPRLRRRWRRRWPHGYLDQQGRRLRLDRQLPAAGRLAGRAFLGRRGARRNAGGAGHAHRAARGSERTDLPSRPRISASSCAGTSRISSASRSGSCPTRSPREVQSDLYPPQWCLLNSPDSVVKSDLTLLKGHLISVSSCEGPTSCPQAVRHACRQAGWPSALGSFRLLARPKPTTALPEIPKIRPAVPAVHPVGEAQKDWRKGRKRRRWAAPARSCMMARTCR